MGKIWRHFLFLLFFVSIFFPIFSCHAQTDSVVFSEIAWAGSSVSTADEWMELYNNSNHVTNLSGWAICNLVKDPSCQNPMVKITSGQIAPGGNFLIANNSPSYLFTRNGQKVESILNIDADIVDSSVSLSNEDFKIGLINSLGDVVDIAGNGHAPFYGGRILDKYYSMFRSGLDLSGENKDSWQVSTEFKNLDNYDFDIGSPENSGMPKIINLSVSDREYIIGDNFRTNLSYDIFDSHSDLNEIQIELFDLNQYKLSQTINYRESTLDFGKIDFCPTANISFIDSTGLAVSSKIQYICLPQDINVMFSEVLPHPYATDFNGDLKKDTGDEWFEITNFSQSEINLSGWTVEAPGESPYLINNITLKYSESAVFYGSQTKISLSDSGDSLRLKNPFGKIVNEVVISSSSSKPNYSYSWWGDSWQWSTKYTPGLVNEIIAPVQTLTGTVSQIDRSSFTIDTLNGAFEVSNTSLYQPKLDDVVKIKGQLYLESAVMLPLQVTLQQSPTNQTQTDLITPAGQSQTTRKSKKTKISYQKLKHLGKVEVRGDLKASKIPPIMVYLFSLFTAITVIFIYEICCRE